MKIINLGEKYKRQMTDRLAKPFLKWAGGKTQLINAIEKALPKYIEAHMKASMIFTSNDVIINTGVIVAGVLVLLTQSKYPDLIIGAIVFLIVVRGAFRILKLGK